MPHLIPLALVLLLLAPFAGLSAEEPAVPSKEEAAPPEKDAPTPGKAPLPPEKVPPEKVPPEQVPPEKAAPKEEAAPAVPAVPIPKSDPAAVALLDRAIAHQAPKELTGLDSIKDISVMIQAEVWDYRGEKPKKQSVSVSRYLTRDPKRFRSEWRTSGGVLINGYDGRRFWFADYDATGKKTRAHLLTGSRYKDDRQRISDEMGETENLIRFFFLGNLKGDKVVLTKKADKTIDAFGKKECFVLHRVNHAKDSAEPALTLWFEKATSELVRAVAHARSEKDRTLQFTFLNDAEVQPRVKGVLFPFKMELREKSAKIAEYRLSTKAILLEEGGIDFNSDIDKKRFLAPIGEAEKKEPEKDSND